MDRVMADGQVVVLLDEGETVELYPHEIRKAADRIGVHFVNGYPFFVADRIVRSKEGMGISPNWRIKLDHHRILQWGEQEDGTTAIELESDHSWSRVYVTAPQKLVSRALYLYYQHHEEARGRLYTGSVVDLERARQLHAPSTNATD